MATDQKSVEIDNRLTDLFIARRNQSADAPYEEHLGAAIVQDDSWLQQFKGQINAFEGRYGGEGDLGESSVVTLDTRLVKPFWEPENTKLMLSLWKKSKAWLSKDCQKQRKAALRKSSHK